MPDRRRARFSLDASAVLTAGSGVVLVSQPTVVDRVHQFPVVPCSAPLS